MGIFDGYLFSKLQCIGTFSEGPLYILQQFDYSEVIIVKTTELWEEDPELHKFLGKKVTVEGMLYGEGIHYVKISPLKPHVAEEVERKLEVDLKLETDVLWVNKQPPQKPPIKQSMDLALLVRWPYRSIWHGLCPTTQIYDFFIEYEGTIIWQWSRGKVFIPVLTPVSIIGNGPVEYPVTWHFSPDEIESEGTYTARAIFVASGQEVAKDFEVKFAH